MFAAVINHRLSSVRLNVTRSFRTSVSPRHGGEGTVTRETATKRGGGKTVGKPAQTRLFLLLSGRFLFFPLPPSLLRPSPLHYLVLLLVLLLLRLVRPPTRRSRRTVSSRGDFSSRVATHAAVFGAEKFRFRNRRPDTTPRNVFFTPPPSLLPPIPRGESSEIIAFRAANYRGVCIRTLAKSPHPFVFLRGFSDDVRRCCR